MFSLSYFSLLKSIPRMVSGALFGCFPLHLYLNLKLYFYGLEKTVINK